MKLSHNPKDAEMISIKDLKIEFEEVDIYKTKHREGEIFTACGGKCGWTKRNDVLNDIFKNVIQERRGNQHIRFIEWHDCYLVKFADGVYISSVYAKIPKEEVKEFFDLQ